MAEAAGLASGVAAILLTFKSAVDSFVLIDAITEADNGQHYVALRYFVEKQKLQLWSDACKLDDPEASSLSNESEKTRKLVAADLAEIRAVNSQAAKYLKRYQMHEFEAPQSAGGSSMSLASVSNALVDAMSQDRTLRRPVNRFRWAAKDKQKFTELVERLKALIGDLNELVTSSRSQFIDQGLPVYVIPGIKETSQLLALQHADADAGSLLTLAALLKQLQISTVQSLAPRRIPLESLGLTMTDIVTQQRDFRQVCDLSEPGKLTRRVWIEWKAIGTHIGEKDKKDLEIRIEDLARLLSAPKPSEYRVPMLVGLAEVKETNPALGPLLAAVPQLGPKHFGFVYEYPSETYDDMENPVSLLDLLKTSRQMPSLNDRFELARSLASAMSLLHASRWLHKGFRSSRVLFFSPYTTPLSIVHPYITGFGFSRQEASSASIETVMSGDQAIDLYYHPDTAKGFSRLRDYYSLGIVLFEVALWRSFEVKIAKDRGTKLDELSLEDIHRTVIGSLPVLDAVVGNTYRRVVELCLTGCFGQVDDQNGMYLGRAFFRRVVQELHKCKRPAPTQPNAPAVSSMPLVGLGEVLQTAPLGTFQGQPSGDGATDEAETSLPNQTFDRRRAKYARDLLGIVSYALSLDIPHVSFDGFDGVLQRGQPWMVKPERFAHILGSGATCTVSLHQNDEDIEDVVKAKELVVLKRYHRPHQTEATEEIKAHERLHTLLWQDLRAQTHPHFRNQENVVKLLYIAWQDDSLIPIFALEFAEYGTLDQFVQQNRSELTNQRFLNITVDMFTGVAALHSCDYVHGDLKPSNVLIYRHQDRDVVAKIADFVGSAELNTFGSAEHIRFETEEWLAPEVFQRITEIDWRKADVYSLGLTIAHTWYRFGPAGYCFLHHLLNLTYPGFLSLPRDKQVALIRQCKLESGESESDHRFAVLIEKMYQFDWQHRTDAERLIPEEQDSDNPTFEGVQTTDRISSKFAAHSAHDAFGVVSSTIEIIKRCLNSALKTNPSARYATIDLVRLLYHEPLVQICRGHFDGSTFSPTEECKMEIEKLPDKGSMLGRSVGLVKLFRQRSRTFHKTAITYLLRSLDTNMDIPECFLPDLDEDEQTNDLSVLKWFYANNVESNRVLTPGFQRYSYWSVLAEFHLLGLGVIPNEQNAVDSLTMAARGAMSLAMASYSRMTASCQQVRLDHVSERLMLWLSYGMRNGYRESADVMRQAYPNLYETTRRILIGRYLFSRQVEALLLGLETSTLTYYKTLANASMALPEMIDELFSTTSAYGITLSHAAAGFGDAETLAFALVATQGAHANVKDVIGRSPAWFAIESGSVEALRLLLNCGADPNALDCHGQSLLHRLTLLEDSTACEMGRLVLDQQAKLSEMAIEPGDAEGDLNTRYSKAFGTPLVWAAYRSRPHLFALLLGKHYEHDVHIDWGLWLAILQRISIYHETEMLESILLLKRSSTTNPDPCHLLQDRRLQSSMLAWTVHEPSHHMLGCRFELGSNFYTKQRDFITRILSLGWNPLPMDINQVPSKSALEYALVCGDRQALKLFVEHLESQGFDVYRVLTTDDVPALRYGIVTLIRAWCIDGFLWALQRWPALANASIGAGSTGAKILHHAVTLGEAAHVQALLDAGADRYDVAKSNDATALETAIEAEKLDMADILVAGADAERLIGTPSKFGNSLFGRLLNRTFNSRLRVKIDTFHWLKRQNAIQFFPNAYLKGMSLWYLLFPRRFTARRDFIDEDLQLLDFLTQPDTFQSRIHQTDHTGQAAIHYAARWGNYESVKMLFEKGADINQGVARVKENTSNAPATATPMQLASIARVAVPPHVKEGGAFVLKLWMEDAEKKTSFIASHGGTRGKYQLLLDHAMWGSEWYDPNLLLDENGLMPSARMQNRDIWQGQWPAKLGKTAYSSGDAVTTKPMNGKQGETKEQEQGGDVKQLEEEQTAQIAKDELASLLMDLKVEEKGKGRAEQPAEIGRLDSAVANLRAGRGEESDMNLVLAFHAAQRAAGHQKATADGSEGTTASEEDDTGEEIDGEIDPIPTGLMSEDGEVLYAVAAETVCGVPSRANTSNERASSEFLGCG